MNKTYAAALTAFALSLVLCAALRPLLKRLKAGQYVLGYVKQHMSKNGTPTMGGLAFVCAAAIAGLCFCGVSNTEANLTLVITAGYCLVGFCDDFLKIRRRDNLGLKPYQKIIFQVAIAGIAAAYCYVNAKTAVNVPLFGGSAELSFFIIPAVVFVFIATVNCVNLTDGLDGLAGGTSLAYLVALGGLTVFSFARLSLLCFAMCGALAAFLVFNVNKASVFMGDTGSLALGAFISCTSVFSGNMLYIPIIGVMFVVSGISVIVQVIYYKRTKRRVFLMAPVHHHFQMKGFGEGKIAYVYAVITSVAGLLCLMFA